MVSTWNALAAATAGALATATLRGSAFTSGAIITGAFTTGVVEYVPEESCDSETEVLSVFVVSALFRSTK